MFICDDFLASLFRFVYRDLGGSDPERMAPPRVAEYVQELFKDTNIKVGLKKTQYFLPENHHIFLLSAYSSKPLDTDLS